MDEEERNDDYSDSPQPAYRQLSELDSSAPVTPSGSGYRTPSSTASLPYILMPNVNPPPIQDMNSAKRPRPSFPVPSPTAFLPTTTAANSRAMNSSLPPQMSPTHPIQLTTHIKGPQHRHAHHLHSIPPREKTTRTLILDHMLSLHARARFAQVRSELGMNPDRAGSAEDEDEYISFGAGDDDCADSDSPNAAADRERDAANARAFKARADGIEKVLSAMLDQSPEELPFDADDLLFRDTSFSVPAVPLLPNGVRLRLSLAGLINDMFAEDSVTVPNDQNEPLGVVYYPSAPPQLGAYTPALQALSRLSSFAHHNEIPVLPPFQMFAATADPNSNNPPAQSILPPPQPVPPAGSIFSTIPRGAGPESAWALGGRHTQSSAPFTHSQSSSSAGNGLGGNSNIPAIRSSGSGQRFPTNLDMPPPPPRVFRAVGRSRDLYNAGIHAAYSSRTGSGSSSSSSRPRRCPHHLSYVCPPSSFCLPSLSSPKSSMSKLPKSRTRSSIGAGLSSSGPPLRRAPLDGRNKGKDARMTDLLPRFLRVSALVAVELGREARREEERAEEVARLGLANVRRKDAFGRARAGSNAIGPNNEPVPPSTASSGSYDSDDETASGSSTAAPKKPRINARPTKLWYQLLAGLLTRSALQGYLVKGWKGTDAVEVLLGVGIGGSPPPPENKIGRALNANDEEEESEEEDEEKEYEPDDMPDLTEAWHILFGFNANSASGPAPGSFGVSSKEALDEYERIMAERMSDFFALPANCPDLASHLHELSLKYPSGPVDRAVLKFCEAVSRWRGKPELETYKSRNSDPPTPMMQSHHQPTSRPLIERYFMLPSKADRELVLGSGSVPASLSSGYGSMNPPISAWDRPVPAHRRDSISSTGTKRSRRSSWADGKGKKVVIGQAWMEEDEYVGPYGI